MNLYAITADYRPHNPNKPVYYVKANTPKEAKQIFTDIMGEWMKIYEVKELGDIEADKILQEGKYKHIIF